MTLLERRRALMMQTSAPESLLPYGYTQVEYIQSTGTQYIVTDFEPNQDTRVVVDFQYTELAGTFVFGSRMAPASEAYTLSVSSSNFVSAYGNIGNKNFSSANTERHTVDKDKNLVYYDGKLRYTFTGTDNVFECSNPLTIFACYYVSNKGYAPSKAKIYSFKIYDNEVLARDYIPCINPNGEVGLYDIVNKAFVGNSGSGTLIGG